MELEAKALSGVLGGMTLVADGREKARRRQDARALAIGVPSAGLSLGWMLASRANLRFTRRKTNTEAEATKQEQAEFAGHEDLHGCS